MYTCLYIAFISISFWYVYKRKGNKYKLPPGPFGLPVIGIIHELILKSPFEKLNQWADKYGKIYTIDFCTKKAIVINEPKLMRDILSTYQSTGKFQTDTFLQVSNGPYGVLNTEGAVWSDQRTFCMKKLKEFGFGNKRMETLILSEAEEVCKWIQTKIKENGEKSLTMQPIFIQSVINTIWTMITGTRITLGDSKITKLMEVWSAAFQRTTRTGLTFVPWLKYVAPELSGYNAYNNACLNIIKYIEHEFVEHKKTFSPGAEKDLIDAYIEEAGNDPLNWKHAVGTVVEMFVAASETTASILTWLLCYLSVNPEIQLKLQQEIDTIVGDYQEISLDHKTRMPYTEAVILETMRLSSLHPIGLMHQLLDDLEIDEYKLPKGLILIPNMYYCQHNKVVWGDPKVFRPQRFLDKGGEKLKNHVVPFQLGKRQCAGEPLARDMLFIFVTRIFQLFDVKPDKDEKPSDYYKPDIGYVHFPPSLGLSIKPRKKRL